jgi:hypothetical protein
MVPGAGVRLLVARVLKMPTWACWDFYSLLSLVNTVAPASSLSPVCVPAAHPSDILQWLSMFDRKLVGKVLSIFGALVL